MKRVTSKSSRVGAASRRPVGVLHHLDGLLTLASLASHSSGAPGRRQKQRLALAQRLLDPLPKELAPALRIETVFWRMLRWGTLGLVLAWWLRP
ncbi:hypothetical protein [Cyanobium sp. PCC 7001]|uniref:hypothetical protein n=1 Tax=Cyanobium sp. PCC 7001 TaxID=180281 RepID=UPI0005BA080E|nr:hypothetical protein [Cyanobium sp. PCC 7001]